MQSSGLDPAIQNALFHRASGQWLIAKNAYLPHLLLYSGLKKALMLFAAYVLLGAIYDGLRARGLWRVSNHCDAQQRYRGYALTSVALSIALVALLKYYTHIACPVQLALYGGSDAYLTLLDVWRMPISDALTNARCFPAAHANVGFSLLAFSLTTAHQRTGRFVLCVVLLLGWVMGGYKMAIGDHFFSHTLTSMGLSLCVSGLLFLLWHKALNPNHSLIK